MSRKLTRRGSCTAPSDSNSLSKSFRSSSWFGHWPPRSVAGIANSQRRSAGRSPASGSTCRRALARPRATPGCGSKAPAARCTKRRLGSAWRSPGAICRRSKPPPRSRPWTFSGVGCSGSAGEELEVGRATVERVRRRAVEEGLERALNRKRSETPPRPPKLDGAGEAHLVLLACSAPPEGRQRWTLHLLSERLVELGVVDSISHSTVHRRLKKKRAEALANRALLHPAGGERRFRPCHGGRARRLPSSV